MVVDHVGRITVLSASGHGGQTKEVKVVMARQKRGAGDVPCIVTLECGTCLSEDRRDRSPVSTQRSTDDEHLS